MDFVFFFATMAPLVQKTSRADAGYTKEHGKEPQPKRATATRLYTRRNPSATAAAAKHGITGFVKVGSAFVVRARLIVKPTREQIADRCAASLMSDAKWRKLFAALDSQNADVKLEQLVVKFIDVDTEHRIAMPGPGSFQTLWAFADLGSFGPTALREIEWIEFPAYAEYQQPSPNGSGRVPLSRRAQDIDGAEAAIAKLGKYPMERTARGLRVTGHVRRTDPS
ncbi:MAG TPA: DUF6678 family protein [Rhizomicrobium sp.]|nr:DUF6678 family protein [Rhizomicrobium sp.]